MKDLVTHDMCPETGRHRLVVNGVPTTWKGYSFIACFPEDKEAKYFAVTEYYAGMFIPGKVYEARLI